MIVNINPVINLSAHNEIINLTLKISYCLIIKSRKNIAIINDYCKMLKSKRKIQIDEERW